MNAKSFINKIASTHPNVLAKKLVKKSSMVVIDFFAEFLDRKYGTYFIGKTKFIAKEFVLDEHSLDNDAIITFADNICEHRFRFLGIKNCNLNLNDKSININYSNYYKSEAIESLIVGIYRKIKWHSDFNTKYNWNTDVWYKKIKFGINNSDIKIPWELSRFQFSYFLFMAYKITGDSKYAFEFRNLCLDFFASNPPKFGVNWKSPMDVGIRAMNMLFTYNSFVSNSYKFDEKFKHEFADYNYYSLKFVYKNPEFSSGQRGNHYLSNLCSLNIASQFYDTYESKKWFDFAIKALGQEIEYQFLKDGGNFEASLNYHCFAVEMLFTALYILKKFNKKYFDEFILNKIIRTKLEKIIQFTRANLQELSNRNYFISQIGDNDSGLFLPFFADLNEENDGFNTSNKHYLIKLFDCFPEFHPIDNNHNKFINFNEFGLAVFKNDEIHFDIRCGSVGQYGKGGHAHNDQLSFTLSVNNNPIIVDSGTYNYTANLEMRNKFRSTEMHNTLIIENMEQNPISNNKVDLFWLKDNSKAKNLKAENNEFIGIHSGYGKPHRREIKIIDNVIYGKDICEIESNKIIKFHLNPIISPKFIENGILIEINGTKLALSSMTGKFSVEDSIYSKEYGIIEKNKVIILESVNFEFNWKIEILK